MSAVVRRRVRTEEVGRESEERTRLIECAARDASWDWNLVTGEVTWTDAIQSAFGYPPEDVDPSIEWWLDRIHPESRDRVAADLFREVKRGGSHWVDEYRFQRHDGSYALVFDRGHVVRDRAGTAVRMVGAMVDISELAEIDAQLHETQGLMHAVL
jgi:PAS domain S-box-containing protein